MTGPDVPPNVPALPVRPRRSVVLVVVLALLAGAGVTVGGLYAAGAFSTEILAEPIQSDGENPFMPEIGVGQPVARLGPKAGVTVSGETSGLYGGTLNNAACDPAKMVTFLQQNPDKAAAWSGVIGIDPTAIPGYVAELTPLILRADTAVTNHGFAGGKATTLNSVLEAGTAVLVDKSGVPRVRCKCGNPLAPAKTFSRPAYEGNKWAEFDPQQITSVQPSAQVINTFVIINLANNETTINRPAGSLGNRDQGQLEDASIAGQFAFVRTLLGCSGFENGCNTLGRPMNIRFECTGSQCTAEWISGGWSRSHPLTRSGNTYRISSEDAAAADCDDGPRGGTRIDFEVTVTAAATVAGVWRATAFTGRYIVSASSGPGCAAGVSDNALSL